MKLFTANQDFYPTTEEVINTMMMGENFIGKTIVEPSSLKMQNAILMLRLALQFCVVSCIILYVNINYIRYFQYIILYIFTIFNYIVSKISRKIL